MKRNISMIPVPRKCHYKMMKYDVRMSVGENCTPAHYPVDCGLRTEAYPLDWMCFSAPTIIHLFRTGFVDFFATVVEEKPVEGNPCRCIRDTANNIHSMHHFPKDREVADVLDEFRDMMRRRYLRLHDRLTNGSSLLMLGYRQATREQLESTLLEFSEIYPHLLIHLVNVQDTPEMASTELRREEYEVNDRLSMTLYHFNSGYDTVNDKKIRNLGQQSHVAARDERGLSRLISRSKSLCSFQSVFREDIRVRAEKTAPAQRNGDLLLSVRQIYYLP